MRSKQQKRTASYCVILWRGQEWETQTVTKKRSRSRAKICVHRLFWGNIVLHFYMSVSTFSVLQSSLSETFPTANRTGWATTCAACPHALFCQSQWVSKQEKRNHLWLFESSFESSFQSSLNHLLNHLFNHLWLFESSCQSSLNHLWIIFSIIFETSFESSVQSSLIVWIILSIIFESSLNHLFNHLWNIFWIICSIIFDCLNHLVNHLWIIFESSFQSSLNIFWIIFSIIFQSSFACFPPNLGESTLLPRRRLGVDTSGTIPRNPADPVGETFQTYRGYFMIPSGNLT